MYGPNTSETNNAEIGGDRHIVFRQDTLAKAWLIETPWAYAVPTVFVNQIGEKVLENSEQVTPKWNYLEQDPYKIQIEFELYPCKGFVILHRN